MGVERFFSSVKKDFNIIKNTNYPYTKIVGKHLFIDFNSIVHVLSTHMIKTINKCIKRNQKCVFNYDSLNSFEDNLLKEVNRYLVDLITENTTSNILETIYIAIDGVPTMGKISEQKKRRYMGSIISYLNEKSENNFSWARNNISPGTSFIKKLQKNLYSKELKKIIQKKCPRLKNFIISDTSIPGEGEMKIVNYIKKFLKNSNDNIIVYSPDSDMIILLMMLDNNLTILRYDQQKSILDDNIDGKLYNILNVTHFIDILLNHIKERIKNINFYKRNVINDIIFIFTIFGDDFLPKLETFRVNTDIFIIIDYYLANFIVNGYLLEKINNIISIRLNSFLNFLKLLSKQELLFLKRNANNHIYSNFNKIENDIFSKKMYIFREMFSEYIWKFIYVTKKLSNGCSSISPNNVSKCYTIDQFEKFIISDDPKIDLKSIEKFTKRKFKYISKNLIVELKNIFSENYLYIVKYIKNKKLFDFIVSKKLVSYRKNLFKQTMEMYYLLDTKDNLFVDFLYIMFYTLELPLNINLQSNHQELKKVSYESSDKFHTYKLNNLDKNDSLTYKMDYKLDEFFTMLNPRDEFYHNYFSSSFPDRESIKNYYKLHFNNEPIQVIINEYLLGLNWVLNYYFNDIIDRTWSYPYGKSPLIFDLINNYNTNILKLQKKDSYKSDNFMTVLEQIIFISPININKSVIDQIQLLNEVLNFEDIQKLTKFIETKREYFFNLDEVFNKLKNTKEKIIDCSTSIFINKCHLTFLEKEIDINKYIKDFRKIFPLEYQKKVLSNNI